jgi:ATP-dependent Clp protease ATP-binding subunit ClpB
MGNDENSYQTMKQKVLEALRLNFRPEFLNRVDDIVVFRALTEKQLEAIVEIQANRLRERLEEKGIILEMTKQVQRHLAQVGYDPVYGARPLKRTIQRELETPIAKEILRGTILEGDHVVAEMEGDRIDFRTKTRGKGRKSLETAAAAD